MANLSSVPHSISEKLRELIPKSKILVVGAGGIGCEVLKNLALSGFQDIEIIDLDTIDVSNLNRQFLFRKEHVGKPKAVVARESILSYNPNINIKAYHDTITSQDYGVNFFKRFNVVLNALDNRVARNHVNRMCLAADIPLIESGTAGYSGQVELIKKGFTQCYECLPKPSQKTFAGCTIRNTPSEPVHCIVWAKHLFNQLFGENDPDQDVSPDTEDPEAKGEGELGKADIHRDIVRVSTHQWAQDVNYDPEKLFDKFFKVDIEYLLSMENLWKTRKAPVPLTWQQSAKPIGNAENEDENDIRVTDMKVWSLSKCCKVFANTISQLKAERANRDFLVWDKDDKVAMDFVTACANIRARIFSIPEKSRFEIKSIAGNIIPAIATANAIIAGLVVLYAFRALSEEYDKCPAIYLRQKSTHSKIILAADRQVSMANPVCYVCSPKPFVNVFINVNTMTVKEFENELLKKELNMVAPDVLDGIGSVVISSEEGETMANDNKKLVEMGIVDGSVLKCDDFLQNYELTIAVNHYEAKEKDDPPYKVVANPEELKARNGDENGVANENKVNNKEDNNISDDDDDLILIEYDDEDPQEGSSSKKRKVNPPEDRGDDEDDDLCVIED